MNTWNITEEEFSSKDIIYKESIFSLGNGKMGRRANFEENYSGDSLNGSYVAGIYYPDKTRVGWWKNGYPEYYARIANTPNWSKIGCRFKDEELDLYTWEVKEYKRELNMKEGYLRRQFEAISPRGTQVRVEVTQFISMVRKEVSAIKYNITSVNFNGKLSFVPTIDGVVKNETSNYTEAFWNMLSTKTTNEYALMRSQTKRSDFHFCAVFGYDLLKNNTPVHQPPIKIEKANQVGFSVGCQIAPGDSLTLYKYITVLSSLQHDRTDLEEEAIKQLKTVKKCGWNTLFNEQVNFWAETWRDADVVIEGDDKAQQGIRYNIFQLKQNFSGDDPRLNIPPRGFSGEKYGGCTYWNTEACCLGYYLSNAPQSVARNLLLYRYRHLPKAIANARKLGIGGGAALYPMVTMNGDECHNEWEVAFEEIHRNGAIAYAIFNYVNYTGDRDYLKKYGLETLIAISRFWAQRVSYSERKKQYVILGVTGPNNYENNVDNNWYTNYIARWCLNYTTEVLTSMKKEDFIQYEEITTKTSFQWQETLLWEEIARKMYLPEDKKLGIFIQQDGYLDKELKNADEIPPEQRPIWKNWSWDRILRSCFVKQSDVLQGIYFFETDFSLDTIRKNFDFYEPKTIHESSLSPFVHSIIAARLGNIPKAYELFLCTARMDLDDNNNNTVEGLHVASMSGSWLAIVNGMAGMRVIDGILHFAPQIPAPWSKYSFKIKFRQNTLRISIDAKNIEITNESGNSITVDIQGKKREIEELGTISVAFYKVN